MPDTITAYYTFNPRTKAKSSEVNQNFNNYRGSILPINTDTQTASDNTHDLGKADKRWRTGYFGTSLDMEGITSTGNAQIENSGITAGGIQFRINDTVTTRFHGNDTALATLTGSYGQIVILDTVLGLSFGASDAYGVGTTAAMLLPRTTLTIATSGRPIEYGFIPYSSGYGTVPNAGAHNARFGAIQVNKFSTVSGTGQIYMYLVRDGVTITGMQLYLQNQEWLNGTTNDPGRVYWPASAIKFYDFFPTPTTAAQYELQLYTVHSQDFIEFYGVIPYVKEWK